MSTALHIRLVQAFTLPETDLLPEPLLCRRRSAAAHLPVVGGRAYASGRRRRASVVNCCETTSSLQPASTRRRRPLSTARAPAQPPLPRDQTSSQSQTLCVNCREVNQSMSRHRDAHTQSSQCIKRTRQKPSLLDSKRTPYITGAGHSRSQTSTELELDFASMEPGGAL